MHTIYLSGVATLRTSLPRRTATVPYVIQSQITTSYLDTRSTQPDVFPDLDRQNMFLSDGVQAYPPVLPPLSFAIHFMKPLVSSSRFKFLPMKTILQRRSSPGCQEPCCELAKSMWIAWKTNFSFMPFTARTPFERKRSTPFSLKSQPTQSLSFCCTTSPGISMPTEDTRASCW